MQRFLILALASLALWTGGCKKEVPLEEPAGYMTQSAPRPAAEDARAAAPQAAPAKPAPPAEKQARAIPRKLLRTVDLQLEVKDSREVAKRVEAMVNQMGGYVSASNAQRQGELFVYTMTLRVPAERFDQALNTLRSLAARVNR